MVPQEAVAPESPFPDGMFGEGDPLPILGALRKANPVMQFPGGAGLWGIFKYDDCLRILRDPQTFSSQVDAASMRGDERPPTILFDDPPIHTRMRGLLTKAFTPRVIELQREAIRANCDTMIGRLCASDAPDVIAELAYPLPVQVIAGMLGVQGGDMATFKRWSDAIIENVGNALFDGDQSAIEDVNNEFNAYFTEQLDKLRLAPEDNLLSEMIHAVGDDGSRLSQDDLLLVSRVLLVAGNETTTGLLINAARVFATFPHALAAVRERPELIPSFIEETLRYYPPFPATIRRSTRDVEVRGVTIPKDSRIIVMLTSANHDEDAFERPDDFIVDREPNRHIGFGMGIHYCLGAPLARLEGEEAIRALAPRILSLELVDPEAAKTMKPGGPEALPVRLELDPAYAAAVA